MVAHNNEVLSPRIPCTCASFRRIAVLYFIMSASHLSQQDIKWWSIWHIADLIFRPAVFAATPSHTFQQFTNS